MAQAFKIELLTVTTGATTTYTVPARTSEARGVSSISFQAMDNNVLMFDNKTDADAGTDNHRTIVANQSLEINVRYLEETVFYFKSANGTAKIEILYLTGLLT